MSAVRTLLANVLDYAGLFPPEGLGMEAAVRKYHQALEGRHAWMLGSFVVPAPRLAEFTRAFEHVCCGEQEQPWTLSVLCPTDADRRAVQDFREGAVFIRAIEAKAADRASAGAALRDMPQSRTCYLEFPPEKAGEILPVVAAHHGRAKLRTGGLTPDAIPPVKAVIGFLRACSREPVAWKATAGLHHPVRGEHALAPDGPRATLHGFVNLLLAAALAFYGADDAALRRTLAEEDAAAFALDGDLIRWHDHTMTADQLEPVRRDFAISFGSCSFAEPVTDLQAMGWL